MQSFFVCGYGFGVTCSDESLLAFIKNHQKAFCSNRVEKQLFQQIVAGNVDKGNLEDYLEQCNYECECSGHEGRGAVISNIMYRETGIRFEYQSGDSACYSFPTVLLAETMPWHNNEIEKNLTQQSLHDICAKYAVELDIGRENIGSCEIEYYG